MGMRQDSCNGYELPCRDAGVTSRKAFKKRYNPLESLVVDALPRDTTYSYMPPAYYAKGYRIIPSYKKEFDFTEMKKLFFLEDPEQTNKWGNLRRRLPYPETRVVDLPGTRDLHYKNYCLRSLTPESTMSWRKSISVPAQINRDAVHFGTDRTKNTTCNNANCPFFGYQ